MATKKHRPAKKAEPTNPAQSIVFDRAIQVFTAISPIICALIAARLVRKD